MQEALSLLSKWWKHKFSSASVSKPSPQMGKIDATVEKALAQYFGIKGYPTLKLILSIPENKQVKSDANFSDDTDTTTSKTKMKKDDNAVFIFDYDNTSKDRDSLISFILHYWFRFIYSPGPHLTEVSPVIWMNSADEFKSFLNDHQGALLSTDSKVDLLGIHITPQENETDHEEDGYKYDFMEQNSAVVFVMCNHETDKHSPTRKKELNDQFATIAEQLIQNTDNAFEKNLKKELASVTKEIIDENSVGRQNLQREFEEAAFQMIDRKDVAFFALTSTPCHHLGFSDTSSVKAIFPPFDEDAIRSGPLHHIMNEEQSLMDFVRAQSTPRLVWFDQTNTANLAFRGDYSIHTCLFVQVPTIHSTNATNSSDEEGTAQLSPETKSAIDAMKTAANTHTRPKENVFLIIPHTEQRIIDYFGIHSFPTLMITDMRKRNGMLKYFLHQNDIINSVDSVSSFFGDFYNNRLVPTLKSETLSKEDTIKPVKVVKGDSFHSMVMEGSKHAFVNFYAPWCAHCKNLSPKWNELAETFAQSEEWMNKIDIMKMDATKNEVNHPSVDILVFPTIYFFPRGHKTEPILYNGTGTDPNDFVAWLSLHRERIGGIMDDENEILLDSSRSVDSSQDEL